MTPFQKMTQGSIGRVVIASCLAMLAACSDGAGTQLPEEGPAPALTKPSIEVFEVTSAADAENTSESEIVVASGEGITLTWRTSNAETVELSSAGPTLPLEKVEAAGSKEIESLTASETFTLTAKTGGVTTSKAVTVTVAAPRPTAQVLEFYATPEGTVEIGMASQLCYAVSAEAVVEIVNVETKEKVSLAATDEETVDEEPATEKPSAISAMLKLSLAATPDVPAAEEVTPETTEDDAAAEEEPAEDESSEEDMPDSAAGEKMTGCSVPLSLPAGTHTFRLTVTDVEGNTDDAETTITVAAAVRVVEFTVNGGASAVVQWGGPLSFAFTVEPADAKVTLQPGFGAVVVDADGKGVKNTKAETLGTTTYTLSATDPISGTATDSKTVTVTVGQQAAVTAPKLTASTRTVFAGESVTFTVSDVTQGMTVSLRNPEGQTTAISGAQSMAVTHAGAYQAVGTLGGTQVFSNAETIDVRTWGSAKGGTTTWGAVTLSSNGELTVAGGAPVPFIGASASSNDWYEAAVAVTSAFEGLSHVPADRQGQFGPNPIYGVAIDTAKNDGKRVYAGVGGGVLFSEDGGKSWKALDHMLIWKDGSSVPTAVCRGGTRPVGDAAQTDVIAVHHVCDVVVDAGSGRLFAAVDDGVIYLENPDAAIADVKDKGKLSAANGWKGYSAQGTVAGGSLSNTLVNDIDLGGGTLYAATKQGVYANSQAGADGSWTALSGGVVDGKDVYAVAADATNGVVYAGTADGTIAARTTSGEGATWTSKKSVGAVVYSLSVDYSTGDVLAGTGAGVLISRDKGETWTDISASMDTKVVYGVAIQSGNNGQVYAAATDKGVYVSRPAKKGTPPPVSDEPVPPPPGEEPPLVVPTTPPPPTGGAADTNASIL